MVAGNRKHLLLLPGALVSYLASATVLLSLFPGARAPADLMVIGSVATFVSLLAVFFISALAWFRTRDIFFIRRKRTLL